MGWADRQASKAAWIAPRVTLLPSRRGRSTVTCPTRQDGKYGHGACVAPHTYLAIKSVTPGEIHYFADQADLDALLAGFRLVWRKKREGHWDNHGVRQFYSNWHILVERRPSS